MAMRSLVPILCIILSLLSPSPVFSGEALVLRGRQTDFLEIQGTELEALQGKSLEQLELLVARGNTLHPIPFQVDERAVQKNGRLEWILPLGPKGGLVQDDGLLDADDELVLMAKDLGVRAGRGKVNELTPPIIEIKVTDPLTKESAYAYLSAASGTPRRSDEDYAHLDPGRDYIETPVYKVGHSDKFPIAHNENILREKAGGTGVDMIDLHKQRYVVTAFFGSLKIEKVAEDWTSEISAFKDGPVRAIRKNENRLYIAGNIKSPSLYTTTFYFRDTFLVPGEITIPFRLSSVLTSLLIYQATEFSREAIGMQLFSNSIPDGILIDGVMSREEKDAVKSSAHTNQKWQIVIGTQGTWFNRVLLGPGLEEIRNGLYYMDDAESEDPPEEEPGIYGNVGFSLTNLENLKGGMYTFRSYIHFPEHFKLGDQKRIFNMLDHPLQVDVHAL